MSATPASAATTTTAAGSGAPKLTHAQLRDQLKAAERAEAIAAAQNAKAAAATQIATTATAGASTAAITAGAKEKDAKSAAPAAATPEFEIMRHIKYFESHINLLPEAYLSLDHSRMHVVYFGLSALDMLDSTEKYVGDAKRRKLMIDWIYNLQIQPTVNASDGSPDYRRCGFRGATIMGQPFDANYDQKKGWNSEYDESNMAMTYTALTSLLILGDDLSRVNRKAVIGALRHLQQTDGSFSPTLNGGEHDMRFVYCACAISHLLGDWSGFDLDLTTRFILKSQSYDGAFGLSPHLEGHGGSTYTAVASLKLLQRLDLLDASARGRLLKWCLMNQGTGGYRGRPNKPEDCCYSFWIAAVFQILGVPSDMLAQSGNRCFNMKCQSKYGGFSKYPDHWPDVLHAHYGLAGLALIGQDGLKSIDVTIGLTNDTLAKSKSVLSGSPAPPPPNAKFAATASTAAA